MASNPDAIATVRVADCNLWRVLSGADRRGLLAAMHRFFGGSVPAQGRGQVLPDARAYRLFDTTCRLRFASLFKLYKLYARAAAFTPGQ